MNVFELTRALVDIESITGNEEQMGDVLFAHLSELAAKHGGHAELMPVEPRRNNISRLLGRADGHAFHAHGHGAAVFSVARR